MRKHFLSSGIGLLAMSFIASAYADDPAATDMSVARPTIFTLSGFGTVGAVQTNTNNGLYTTGAQTNGATKTANFTPDSKFGAQIDAKFNPDFSATLQAFSHQNAVGSYEPDIEWAFGKIKMGGGFDLRLGRMGAPFFMSSDFRNVGYTNVSVRTPSDVYESVPVRSYDGGDILYQGNFGETTFNSQLWLGRAQTLTGPDAHIWLHNIVGLNLSAENGPVTVRAGRMKTRLGTSGSGLTGFNTLLGGLNTFGQLPGLGSLATTSDELAINNKYATFTGIGMTVDLTDWVLNTEWTKRKTESIYIPDITAWYATLGYRISKFTPYVSFSSRQVNTATSVPTPAVPAGYPLVVQGTVPVLLAAANGLVTNQSEKTSALGVRWDAGSNYDIKAEFQQIRVPAGSTGVFKNVQGGAYSVNTNINVFSLCVDFVF